MSFCNSTVLPKQCSLPSECQFNFQGPIDELTREQENCENCKSKYNQLVICLEKQNTKDLLDICRSSFNLKCTKDNSEYCYSKSMSHLKNFPFEFKDDFECIECTRQFIAQEKLFNFMNLNGTMDEPILKKCGKDFLQDVVLHDIDPYRWMLPLIIGGFLMVFVIIIMVIFFVNKKKSEKQQNEQKSSLFETDVFASHRPSLFATPES